RAGSEQEQIGDAGENARALQVCGLANVAPTTVRHCKENETGLSPQPEMLDNCALQSTLRLLALAVVTGGSHVEGPRQEVGNVGTAGAVAGRSPIRRGRIAGQGRPIERRPHRMRRFIVTLDARGKLRTDRRQRDGHQGEALGAALGLLKVRPSLARDRDWFPQVVAAVTLQYDAGERQAVSVVERVVAIAVSAPPPIAQTVGGWWVALDAEFSARGMGTSKLRLRKTDPLPAP